MTKPFWVRGVNPCGAYTSDKVLHEKLPGHKWMCNLQLCTHFGKPTYPSSSTSARTNERFSHSKIRMNV